MSKLFTLTLINGQLKDVPANCHPLHYANELSILYDQWHQNHSGRSEFIRVLRDEQHLLQGQSKRYWLYMPRISKGEPAHLSESPISTVHGNKLRQKINFLKISFHVTLPLTLLNWNRTFLRHNQVCLERKLTQKFLS